MFKLSPRYSIRSDNNKRVGVVSDRLLTAAKGKRALASSVLIAASLTACSGTEQIEKQPFSQTLLGAAVADEPNAVLVAQEILKQGGNAADAVIAGYFAMAVTMPSSAALGGGGVCVIHEGDVEVQKDRAPRQEALDFLPRIAINDDIALPANVRGMEALHARYGQLRWSQLLSPAERLARDGFSVSRALAREILTAQRRLQENALLYAQFSGLGGSLFGEGETLRQPELAAVLRVIAERPGNFNSGPLAQQLAAAAAADGIALSPEVLQAQTPHFAPAARISVGRHEALFAPTVGGVTTAQLLSLTEEAGIAGVDPADRAPAYARIMKRVMEVRQEWLLPDGGSRQPIEQLVADQALASLAGGVSQTAPGGDPSALLKEENPWTAGIAAIDANGMGVACNFTLNRLFGSGRMLPGTGILLAAAPKSDGSGFSALNPVVVGSRYSGNLIYAAISGGGASAISAQADNLVRSLAADRDLASVIAAPRLHFHLGEGKVYYEEAEDAAAIESLRNQGWSVAAGGIVGRVQAIYCAEGIPSEPESCMAMADPRGNGLAGLVTR